MHVCIYHACLLGHLRVTTMIFFFPLSFSFLSPLTPHFLLLFCMFFVIVVLVGWDALRENNKLILALCLLWAFPPQPRVRVLSSTTGISHLCFCYGNATLTLKGAESDGVVYLGKNFNNTVGTFYSLCIHVREGKFSYGTIILFMY